MAALLTVVALFWPLQIEASLTVTLYLLAGFFVASTVLLRLRAPAWIAVLLLPVAYVLTIDRLEVSPFAVPLAWAVLAFVLLAAGEIAVRRTGEGDRPLLSTIFALRRSGPAWRSLLGSPLFAAGYLAAMMTLLLALNDYWYAPVAVGARRLGTLQILGFTVLLATLAASSVARRTGVFLYFVAWLALIPIGATAANIRDWLGWTPHDADAGRLLAAVSFAYLTIAWLADRRDGRYARPLYLTGYLLLPLAMLISLLDKMVALPVVGFSIVLYAASAALSHVERLPSWEQLVQRLCGSGTSTVARAVRTFWVYLAVWLLPAWAMLLTSVWEPTITTYALVLSGLALAYPAVGLWIKRIRLEYRWPWYLGGYALSAIAPLVALTDTTFRPIVLGLSVGLYVASAIVARRSGWLYPVAVLLPVVLWQALGTFALFERWYGVGLVTLGLVYGGLGLVLQPLGQSSGEPTGEAAGSRWLIQRRIGAYALPFFVVGYALSAIGLARAANQERELATLAFALAALHLAASTFIFRQPLFGWPTALAAASAVMLALAGYDRRYGVGLVALAMVYGIVGVGLHMLVTRQRRLPIRGWVNTYGLPFFVVGYLLGGFGLIWAARQERSLTTLAFGLAAIQYAATAFVFRQPLFGWVTALLVTITYVLGLTLTSIDPSQRGLGLLPGGLLALLIAEGLRRVSPSRRRTFDRLRLSQDDRAGLRLREGDGASRIEEADAGTETVGDPDAEESAEGGPAPIAARMVGTIERVTAWSAPWLVVVCAAALSAPFYSMVDQRTWALSWWGGTLLFAALTALLRTPAGLYPTLIFGSVAYLATGYLFAPAMPSTRSFATLAALTWLFLGAGALLERWRPASMSAPAFMKTAVLTFLDPDQRGNASRLRSLESVRGSMLPWTAPLRLAGWATLLLACGGSLTSAQDGLAAAAALTVLAVLLAILDGAVSYVWLGLAVGALALQHGLRANGIPLDRQPPDWAGAAVATVVIGLLLRTVRHPRVAIWVQPLCWTSLALAAGGVIAASLILVSGSDRTMVQMLALTIGLAGLTTIGHAYWRRDRHLIYGGVGLLEVGLFMELVFFEVGQPQAFALPSGAYLLMIAYLEWRRGSARTVKRLLELSALVLLLGVSLLQGLGFMGDGHDRYVYDTFLLLESAGILALGAVLRWRYTFFLGALALVADVLILLSDPLRALNTWYLVALIGLVLIGAVIWIERQRQQIPLWLEAWRARLEQWD